MHQWLSQLLAYLLLQNLFHQAPAQELTDPSENVFPMIPAGGAHCDMLLAGRDEMVSKDETDFNAV